LEVAEHYALGARRGDAEAVKWLERAAAELVHHDPATALRLLDVALDICGPHPDESLLLVRVRALTGTGRLADTEALARSLLREGLDPGIEAQLHRELGLGYLIQGRSHEAVAEGERYLQLVDDSSRQPRTQAEMAFVRFVDLDHVGARAAAEAAVDEGRRQGDLGAQVAGGSVLAWLDEFRNDFSSALQRSAEILSLVRQPHGADGHVYQPWFVASLVYLEADRLEDVLTAVVEGRAVAERDGFSWSLPAYDAMAAYRLMRLGELDDAAAVAEATLGYMEGVDGWGVALWCNAFVAQVALGRGKFEVAEDHVATAERHLTTGRAQFGFEQTMIAKARLAERRGDPEAACTVLGDTWDLYGAIGVLAGRQALGPDLVRLACGAGMIDRAASVVAELEAGAATAGTPAFRAFADMSRSWLDRDSEAAMAAAELMAVATPRRATAEMWESAAALLREDRRIAEADAAAGRAVERYSLCGADADAQRLAATVTGRRVRVAPRPRFGWESLTATERRVVELIGEGLANRDIAADLFVSRRTVETHVSAAYRKLEVSSRVELARLALGHGRT
jgi:DNA-binding CsgD family transcriptional regulator